MDQATCYHGTRYGSERRVHRHDRRSGHREQLQPVRPYLGRPVPFDWGRWAASAVGSQAGARSLARALLADALGPAAARCDACAGTARIHFKDADDTDEPYDPNLAGVYADQDVSPCLCGDGLRALPVDQLVRDRIGQLAEQQWTLTRVDLLTWLVGQYPEPPRWLVQAATTSVELPDAIDEEEDAPPSTYGIRPHLTHTPEELAMMKREAERLLREGPKL